MAKTRLGLLGSWAAYLGFGAKEAAVVGETAYIDFPATSGAVIDLDAESLTAMAIFDPALFDPLLFDGWGGILRDLPATSGAILDFEATF